MQNITSSSTSPSSPSSNFNNSLNSNAKPKEFCGSDASCLDSISQDLGSNLSLSPSKSQSMHQSQSRYSNSQNSDLSSNSSIKLSTKIPVSSATNLSSADISIVNSEFVPALTSSIQSQSTAVAASAPALIINLKTIFNAHSNSTNYHRKVSAFKLIPKSPPSSSSSQQFGYWKKHKDSLKRSLDEQNLSINPISPLSQLTIHLVRTYVRCNSDFNYKADHNPRRVLTKPSKPCHNDGYDNEDWDYILYVNDVLGSQEGQQYQILDILGQGTFGQVVKCLNLKSKEYVAVKVIKNKPAYYNQSLVEVAILDMLNNHDWGDSSFRTSSFNNNPHSVSSSNAESSALSTSSSSSGRSHLKKPSHHNHIVCMKDTFIFRNHLCIAFEMLSVNLYELIKQNQFRGLSTHLVRVFVDQILDCLVVLNRARIIHCDLKPENILLKNLDSPNIKVIDFGSACHENQTVYSYIQSRFYRSPEVLLGLPYTSTIDMWSVGCIAAELFLGLPLFPGTSEYNQVSRIVEMLGMPMTYMCERGKAAKKFFNRVEAPASTLSVSNDLSGKGTSVKRGIWSLKSMEQFMQENDVIEQPSKRYFSGKTLREIVTSYPIMRKGLSQKEIDKEMRNRQAFVDFLSGLLNLNPFERWSPQQAKMHPFITGEKFTGPFIPPQRVPILRLNPPVSDSSNVKSIDPVLINTAASADNEASSSESKFTIAVSEGNSVPQPSLSATSLSSASSISPSNSNNSSTAMASFRRPRANTISSTKVNNVPPQLQRIVALQQQSGGTNKISMKGYTSVQSNTKSNPSALVSSEAAPSLSLSAVTFPEVENKTPPTSISLPSPSLQIQPPAPSSESSETSVYSLSSPPSL